MLSLERKTFDELINEEFLKYLNNELRYTEKDFNPIHISNRNPKQVPIGTWRRMIHKHIQKHFYN